MLSFISILIFVASLLGFQIFYQIFTHPLAAYSGPLLAKITNFWRLLSFTRGSQHLVDAELHEKYGSVVRDGPDSLLIADIEVFKTIYGFKSTIEKGDFYLSSSNHDPQNPNAFSARTESQHRMARKRLLSPKSLTAYEQHVTRGINAYIAKLGEEVESSGRRLDITSGVERLTFDAMLEVAYGSSMGFVAAGYDQHGTLAEKEVIFPINMGAGIVPWLVQLLASRLVVSFLRKPKFDIHGNPKGISAPVLWSYGIFDRATQSTLNLQPSMLKYLLEIDEIDKRKPDLSIVRHECFNVVFAGTGSTAAALNAILYEIGTHPGWQSLVHSEIKSSPDENDLDSAFLSKLPRLQAFMKESLRLHPPFASPFERVIGPNGESTIAGLKGPLPVGTRVWSNPYIICRSKEVFGKDANELRPERWLENSPERLREMDDTFCVFGRGSRGCVGKDIAWMLMEKTIAAASHHSWDNFESM
ncbi:MAG: hypothetical protein M1837_003510 [Sclerophora amabilis]|nr:MAG: hypothetical protein M1837_003510 [Sclerophora amabilis]